MLYELNIDPRDLLFFRDARPIGGSAEGAGGSWPLPAVFYAAMRSALLNRWPAGLPDFESTDHHFSEEEDEKGINATFGDLKTIGPFPVLKEHLLVPTPLDVEPGGLMAPVQIDGASNLPEPLTYAVASMAPPTKETVGSWTNLDQLERYLAGEKPTTTKNDEVFLVEDRPGVGIDPETGSHLEGIFYQSQYLRLQPEASMTAFAECRGIKRGQKHGEDILAELFSDCSRLPFVFGGQRGLAYLEARRDRRRLPDPVIAGTRVKWVLLSPALFRDGWRPGWVDAEGRVQLKQAMPERTDFRTRREWRKAIEATPAIRAKLVAARIGKPVVYSGWKLDRNRDNAGGDAKPTRLLVPAGSVYYFDCGSEADAHALAKTLHGQVKSDLLGEKGFGSGVCGVWKPGLTHDP